MDITQAYAIAAGGIFLILFLINCLPTVLQLTRLVLYTVKHHMYPYVLSRHRFLGPWTRASVLFQLVYITLNVVCITLQVSTVRQAGLRAGTLSLINMVPLFAGLHYGFLADLFGISLDVYRRIHRSAGLMSFFLALFHAFTSYSSLAKAHRFELILSTYRWEVMFDADCYRGEYRCVCLWSFFILPAIGSPMKSFSVHTKLWLCSSSILLGVICHQTDFFLAYICIFSLACFWQR